MFGTRQVPTHGSEHVLRILNMRVAAYRAKFAPLRHKQRYLDRLCNVRNSQEEGEGIGIRKKSDAVFYLKKVRKSTKGLEEADIDLDIKSATAETGPIACHTCHFVYLYNEWFNDIPCKCESKRKKTERFDSK